MNLFLSYSRGDLYEVDALRQDLERARHDVWFDRELAGGEVWWERILQAIRSCDIFVFSLSPASVRSKVCLLELAYAVALERPIVPVRVHNVDERLAPDPIPTVQIVDYRQRTPESAIDVLLAISQSERRPLPEEMPEPPAVPIAQLGPLRDQVASASLSHSDQVELLRQLRERVRTEDERVPVVALLRELRARSDVVEAIAREIDAVLAQLPRAPRDRRADRGGPDPGDLLRSLVTHIRAHHFTPILGSGMTDSLIGPRQLLARNWAKSFEFPMAPHQREDLPEVARFVAVMTDVSTLRASLGTFYREQYRERYSHILPPDPPTRLDELARLAWNHHSSTNPTDPHLVLARLPCSIYVNANFDNVLADALRLVGKTPETVLCKWKADIYEWPESVFERESNYVPSPDRPLVFHLFGNLDYTESLVITEDDYLDFLTAVAEYPALMPISVRGALTDSALLLLGFGLDSWDVRVLLRSLVSQEGARRLQRYTHVAAQLDLSREVLSPGRARRYLERYFGKFRQPSIDIFWGTVDEFCSELAEIWAAEGV